MPSLVQYKITWGCTNNLVYVCCKINHKIQVVISQFCRLKIILIFGCSDQFSMTYIYIYVNHSIVTPQWNIVHCYNSCCFTRSISQRMFSSRSQHPTAGLHKHRSSRKRVMCSHCNGLTNIQIGDKYVMYIHMHCIIYRWTCTSWNVWCCTTRQYCNSVILFFIFPKPPFIYKKIKLSHKKK